MFGPTRFTSAMTTLALVTAGVFSGLAGSPGASAQPSRGPNCAQPSSQLEMNMCAAHASERADAELNRVYQRQLGRLSGADRDRLIDAELAWIEFRDTECEFQSSKYEGGSIRPMIYHGCVEELTQQRTAELRRPDSIELTYAQSDRHLNRNYQMVRRNTPTYRMDQLVDAQLAWIDYRDANCAYEGQSKITYPLTQNECLSRMSNHRAMYLLQVADIDI